MSNAEGTCDGTATCSAGNWINCTAPTPAAETCNNLDDNCDGVIDDGIDKQNDPINCGA